MAKVISSRVIANNANTVYVTPIDQNEFFDQNNIKTTSPITKTVSESIVYIGLDESKIPSGAKVFDSKSTFKEIHDAAISGNPVYYKDDNALYALSSFYEGAVYFSYVDSQIHTLKVDSNDNRTTTVSRDIVILEYGKNYGQLDALKQYAVNYSGFLLYQANVSNLHFDRFSGIVNSNDTYKIVSVVYSSDGTWTQPEIVELVEESTNETKYTPLLDLQTSRANTWSLKDSALNYDYLIVDYVDVDKNQRREVIQVSNISGGTKVSQNSFTAFISDSDSSYMGWFKFWTWWFTDNGYTLNMSIGEYRLNTSGTMESISKDSTVNYPIIKSLIGVIQPMNIYSNELNGNIDLSLTNSTYEVIQ